MPTYLMPRQKQRKEWEKKEEMMQWLLRLSRAIMEQNGPDVMVAVTMINKLVMRAQGYSRPERDFVDITPEKYAS